jgi:hypothetical protein
LRIAAKRSGTQNLRSLFSVLDASGKFQYCFSPMRSLFTKPLSLLLILMMVLSPLQGALAVSPGQEASAPQAECVHDGGMEMAADDMKDDCEHCSSGHSCSSGHCTPLSTLAVLPAFSYPAISTLTTSALRADVSFANQLRTSLFRPPRA